MKSEQDFLIFEKRHEVEFFQHPIMNDPYTTWFAKGEQNPAQMRAFFVQFAVFSLRFVAAAALRYAMARGKHARYEAWEILTSEIGGLFSATGSADGNIIKFSDAHINWLTEGAEAYGLTEDDLNAYNGIPEMNNFCSTFMLSYGSADYTEAVAAATAIETIAYLCKMWERLETGRVLYDLRHEIKRKKEFRFFSGHGEVEPFHAQHAIADSREQYMLGRIEDDRYFLVGRKMLDSWLGSWVGMDRQRLELA